MKPSTALAMVLLLPTWAPRAEAYRPFDSTDASMAEAGTLELELGPLGYPTERRQHFTWAFGLR